MGSLASILRRVAVPNAAIDESQLRRRINSMKNANNFNEQVTDSTRFAFLHAVRALFLPRDATQIAVLPRQVVRPSVSLFVCNVEV